MLPMSVALVAAAAALVIAWLVGEPFLIERRRERLRAQPFPPQWREILERRVPYVRRLPGELRRQLEQHIQVFVAEKSFVGCAGFEITDEARVTIAAQACLLILNRRSEYFTGLREILVYPGSFIVERIEPAGGPMLQAETRQVRSGESWSHGQ